MPSGPMPSGQPIEVNPASRSNVPSAGHSSNAREVSHQAVSRQTVAGQPYIPVQNASGQTGNANSQVYNAAQEQRKEKSSSKPGFWARSPNFRGLGLKKKSTAKSEP